MVTLTIDDNQVTVPEGTLVIEAAEQAGIQIPRFCYHSSLKPAGACRVCMVEIEGMPKLQTSCTTPVRDGMIVRTDTEQVVKAREMVLEFILVHHPLDCPVCDKGGECDLQDVTYRHGTGVQRYQGDRMHFRKAYRIGGNIVLDQERCIECYRCVRFQEEWPEELCFSFHQRGDHSVLRTFLDETVADPRFLGNTIDLCPVGALTSEKFRFKSRSWELNNAEAVCPHCSVGCNIVAAGRLGTYCRTQPRVKPDINGQWICDRGRFDYDFVNQDRLASRDWEDSLPSLINAISALGEGPAAAMLIDSSISCEDGYAAAKFARCGLRTNAVYQSDPAAMLPSQPVRIDALAGRSTIILVGAELWDTHPVLWLRLAMARRAGKLRILAATEWGRQTLERADESLAIPPEAVASVVAWLGGTGSIEDAAQAADLTATELGRLETWLKDSPSPAVVVGASLSREYGTLARGLKGLRSRTAAVFALPNSSNTLGLVHVGVTTTQAPGREALSDNAVKKTLKKLWGASLPITDAAPSLAGALGSPSLECLYVVGGDPIGEANAETARRLRELDLLIYQGTNTNATSEAAHYVLPMAAFCETDHSRVNMEGRLQTSSACISPPEGVLPGYQLLARMGEELGGKFTGELGALRKEIAACHPSLRLFAELGDDTKEGFLS